MRIGFEKLFASASIALLLSTQSVAQSVIFAQPDLRPVDQAANQADFFVFRARLQSTVARRDRQAILEVVHPHIKNSFGGDDGIAGFKKTWAIDKPNSKLWETLATVLALGGTFGPDDTFTAPYVFATWPQDADSFTHFAVLGSDVKLHQKPNARSALVGTLDFSIVESIDEPTMPALWAKVRDGSGKTGYVQRRFIRSPIDYRAIFMKTDGRWRLQMFLAGD